VRAVSDVCRNEFDDLGFKTAWSMARPSARRHLGRDASPGHVPKILLTGRLDTAFERDSPFQTFQPSTAPGASVAMLV